MGHFSAKVIANTDIEKELSQIGFDEGYRYAVSDKFKYINIKIFDLSPAQANILKQTALSLGTDCATHRDVITGKVDKSNAILGGSYNELKKISEKLKKQPFKLGELGNLIIELIDTKTSGRTKLAGILNITPNSFSDGGKYIEPVEAQKHLIELINDGADIIDIGAESTKPFSEAVSAEEQITRLKPVLEFIRKENIKTPISVDTRSSKVAEYVLHNGVQIINDVSGFDYDNKLAEVVAKYNAGVIIQHSKGTPENMQLLPQYEDVVEEIYFSLKNKIEYARNLGIKNIIADVGIGFGKTKENNYELINRAEEFFSLNCPLMYGVSRKSLLGVKENDNELKDALTLGVSYPLVQKGVDYLRVHNVKLHKAFLNSLSV